MAWEATVPNRTRKAARIGKPVRTLMHGKNATARRRQTWMMMRHGNWNAGCGSKVPAYTDHLSMTNA
ncbi:hypothetical protein SJ05684_c21970 [Sinorhizobium sojae CCBAU 05684]|uniref:Uncharacterized protein n=1 Tax=Sinorhizobium sojae CCBAU 05684 TaxID=716928 RepID=A0A249PCK1_9HYPH|nr:hypothetical protein SJ05684_c21970 [Sinorhizobium sojae CCBAU 05684]